MDPVDSLRNVPDAGRYDTERDYSHGDAGEYCTTPTTIEEETAQGGWTKRTTGSGPPPYRVLTTSMRGDPDYDDDLEPDYTGLFKDTPSGDKDYGR